jgi:DNA-directed RNA polymerase subunit RPC12/RpoP
MPVFALRGFLMDMMNKKCLKCGKGKYVETSIYDDWDGKLHCDKCNHEVIRHPDKKRRYDDL